MGMAAAVTAAPLLLTLQRASQHHSGVGRSACRRTRHRLKCQISIEIERLVAAFPFLRHATYLALKKLTTAGNSDHGMGSASPIGQFQE